MWETVRQFVGIPLVTAVFLFLLHSWQKSKTDKTSREADHLAKQLQELYGPVTFLVGCNEKLLQHHQELLDVYKDHFEGRKFAPEAQDSVMDDAMAAINLMNQYIDRIISNNGRIAKILEDNYANIDHEDIGRFQEFVLQCTRWELERSKEESDKPSVPFPIARLLKQIVFYKQEFVDYFNAKFETKLKRYRELAGQAPVGQADA